MIVLPLSVLMSFIAIRYLGFLAMRGWPQTFLVLSTLPFAVAGSVWLPASMDHNLSTAVWVGLIAVTAIAAQTGIVMVVYLDEAFARHMREGRIQTPADVDAAVVEGASARVRPLLMTVATTGLGLLPLHWESGVGADVSARTAAPVVGGLLGHACCSPCWCFQPRTPLATAPGACRPGSARRTRTSCSVLQTAARGGMSP